jgi:hypothetical protein
LWPAVTFGEVWRTSHTERSSCKKKAEHRPYMY